MRSNRVRRWRKLRHLARLAPTVRALDAAPGVFVWDDLSLLLFTPRMRARTVFVLHHYEPLQHDSAPLEALLWERLFGMLSQCAAVVCGPVLGGLPPRSRRPRRTGHPQRSST
ncbi:hypothetical protein ACIP5N_05235 [Streptomyces sp. NPDC088768]|uniref:hypothetical protein n=1 Tax=Streptomyces sp. NPDC088768 TaxID=3365894 RepID=UPI0038061223